MIKKSKILSVLIILVLVPIICLTISSLNPDNTIVAATASPTITPPATINPTPTPTGYVPHISLTTNASEVGPTAGSFKLWTAYNGGPYADGWMKVSYTISGTGVNGVDYQPLKGYVYVLVGSDLGYPAPELPTDTIIINPIDTAVGDGPKTVTITLSTGESATMTIGDSSTLTTPVPTPFNLPGPQIEAEKYSTMSGVQTETCSEGGLDVTSIDLNDTILYNVNVAAVGQYKVEFRVASTTNTGEIDLFFANIPTQLASIPVPNTGGNQTWITISQNVSFPYAGVRTLSIHPLTVGGYSINWFKVSPVDVSPSPTPTITPSLPPPTTNPAVYVNGHIYDNNTKKAVAGAMVTMDTSSAATDVNGYYRIGHIFSSRPGSVSLTVKATGYQTQTTSVSVPLYADGAKDFYLVPQNTPTPTPGIPAWAPNTSYKVGALVTYGGKTYKCIQAHTSLVGWEPPNVPALWQQI